MVTRIRFLGSFLLIFIFLLTNCVVQNSSRLPVLATDVYNVQPNTGATITLYAITLTPSAETQTLSQTTITQPAPTQNNLPIFTPKKSTAPFSSTVLGLSTGGYPIEVYQYGDGPISVVFIGGIHGGYEWNTILLAYEFVDYFNANSGVVPSQLTVYIIPSANPDGQVKIVGHDGRFSPNEIVGDTLEGRYNANEVDLNRNWGCDWNPDAFWREQKINPGETSFSEIETRLLRDFLLTKKPVSVVFWHSAYPGVFYGNCQGVFQSSQALSTIYANSAQYPEIAEFSGYKVTGDAADWLSSQGIPAIEVELTDHQNTEFDKNFAGVISTLNFLTEQNAAEISSTTSIP